MCMYIRSPSPHDGLPGSLGGRPPAHFGHNPLVGWSVLALQAALAVQVGMVLFGTDEILYEGPLYGLVAHGTAARLTGWHHLFFNVVLALAIIHVVAVLAYAVLLKTEIGRASCRGRVCQYV